jgi:hypothetical protein
MDLQVIQFSDALQISGAQEIPGLSPRSLEVVGPDFRSAVEVHLNEVKSPNFVIASKTRLLVEVPEVLRKSIVTSIVVLSAEFTATFRSKIRFRIGDDPKPATGLRALMQTFLKVLFTTVGSDAFAKRIGGNALNSLGASFDASDTSNITSEFSIAVNRTVEQVRSLQSYQPRLADDERLMSAELLHIRLDPATTALVARVSLIPQSGERAIVNLEL